MSDTGPQLPVLTAERLADLERRVAGNPNIRAIESSATVLALGGLFYMGAVAYNIISDIDNRVSESIEDATTGVNVSAVVFSDEGFEVLKQSQLRKPLGRLRFLEFNMDYQRARTEYESFGMVKALPGTAARIKGWEDVVRKAGLITKEEQLASVHPFDMGVGSLLNNRSTYWALVAGVAVLPVLPVLGKIFRGVLGNDS